MHEIIGNVIYSYTRADAINDGVLINLSTNFADECRMYRYPVACTSGVWSLVEQATANHRHGNSFAGVVWDILYMSQKGIVSRPDAQTVLFDVIITGTGRNRLHRMKAVCHPGDAGEPVITIMLPGED